MRVAGDRKAREGRRGSIIIFTSFFILFGLAWTATGLRRSATNHDAALFDRHSQQAVHLAESGLDQAIQNLRTIDGQDDVFAGTLPAGTFTIDTPLTVLEPLLYEAHARGAAAGVERSVDAVLQVTPLSLFRFALFGDEGLSFGGDARVDSYDSRNGLYDPVTNQAGNGDLGTNSTAYGGIDLDGSSYYVDGQLSIGPDVADPAAAVDGLVPGLVSADPPVVSSPDYPLPTVEIPEGVTCNDLSLSGSVVWTLPSPGVYCFEDLEVRGGATLTSTGPVTIYLTQSLAFEGDSTIGVVGDPTQTLFLMASGTSVTMTGAVEGEAEMYAAMYGPDATISIAGDAVIYGSVIGSEIHMAGNSRLHYDEALADIDTLSNEGVVELLSWRTEN